MLDLLISYQWEIFIAAEVFSLVCLLLFGIARYLLGKRSLSMIFLILFIVLLALEAALAMLIYQETGEISTFQIVVTIFVLYACTFGISDFKRLDRWMRKKIGNLRGVELLTAKDYEIMERNSDPKYIAKKYRISSLIHLIIFVIAQAIFWSMGTESMAEMKDYITDFSWLNEGTAEASPYPNETIYTIGVIWGIVFIIDFIYSWSYTFFPSK